MRRILAAMAILVAGADFAPVVEQVPGVPTGWYREEVEEWVDASGETGRRAARQARTYWRFTEGHVGIYVEDGRKKLQCTAEHVVQASRFRLPARLEFSTGAKAIYEFRGHELVVCSGREWPADFTLRGGKSVQQRYSLVPCGEPVHLKWPPAG